MDLKMWLPVVSKIVGRDISPEVNEFFRARAAIGRALNPEGQKFFISNWKNVADFMETPKGQEAIVAFMNSWASMYITEPPKPVPQPQFNPPPPQTAPAQVQPSFTAPNIPQTGGFF